MGSKGKKKKDACLIKQFLEVEVLVLDHVP